MNNEPGYKKLIVWQEAHRLVLLIYKSARMFPKEETFALTSQLRRAVVSVPANIVEGQARSSKKEFLQFLSISNGSLVEVEYYIELACDLGYISKNDRSVLDEQHIKVGNLLHGLMVSLRRSSS